jgi:hypothetical protein
MKTRTIIIGIILACGGLFVAAIAACAGFVFFTFKNMDAAVSPKIDELFAAIDNGTFGDKYETETTPEFKKVTSRTQWEQIGMAVKTRLGRLKAKKLGQFNIQQLNADQSADVSYSATFEKGSGEILTRFRRTGGQWRLVSFFVRSPEFLIGLSTKACPYCGEACPASAKFCPKCGKPLEDHGRDKPAMKNDGHHVNGSTTGVAPPTRRAG